MTGSCAWHHLQEIWSCPYPKTSDFNSSNTVGVDLSAGTRCSKANWLRSFPKLGIWVVVLMYASNC